MLADPFLPDDRAESHHHHHHHRQRRVSWAFTGGTIKRAAVDVSGAPFVDLAVEARMAFMRD